MPSEALGHGGWGALENHLRGLKCSRSCLLPDTTLWHYALDRVSCPEQQVLTSLLCPEARALAWITDCGMQEKGGEDTLQPVGVPEKQGRSTH